MTKPLTVYIQNPDPEPKTVRIRCFDQRTGDEVENVVVDLHGAYAPAGTKRVEPGEVRVPIAVGLSMLIENHDRDGRCVEITVKRQRPEPPQNPGRGRVL